MSFGTRNALSARLARQLRCAAKFLSISQTLERVDEKTDPVLSAQAVGIEPALLEKAVQSGSGIADPMHVIWRNPVADCPLARRAGATSVAGMSLRNIPIPPRTFPQGAPNPGIPVVP